MRTLGRLGEPLRSSPGFRSRRRLGRPVGIAVVVALAVMAWLGITANRQLEPTSAPASTAAQAVPSRHVATHASRGAEVGSAPFASVEGLVLTIPHHAPVAVGFHEGSRAEALALQPLGRLLRDDSQGSWPRAADGEGPAYTVLAPQGSARPPTSAVDVALPSGSTVLAPVSGTVTAVTEYPLVGQTRDWRIIIAPTDRPDLAVSLSYLSKPRVAVGDTVVAGETPLATPRVLPFATALDAVADPKLPRVTLQVQPGVTADGIDPNAPAVSAEPNGRA